MAVKLISILLLETALSLTLITGRTVFAHKIEESLKSANNAVIKSIQSEDGDIIDCFDIYKQPTFRHPALRNHKIQMKPSFVPTEDITSTRIKRAKKGKNKQSESEADVPISVTAQLWQRNGSCPAGTVPIRRHTRKLNFNGSKEINALRRNHSVSIMITEGYAYLGAKGDLAIFNPQVELDNEYSLSHISLDNGGHHNFEEVRSGWAVNPGVYGDRQTRFFTYWTADGSQKTGCFDHICPGFVQISNDIALGAAVHPNISSRPNGFPAAVMTIYIHKDTATNNWWVNFGENQDVGYWPAELFRLLNHHAQSVQWGGDVHSSRVGETHPHSKTEMGNGQYAVPINAGEVRRLRVLENSMVLKYPEWATTYADEFQCYNYFLYRDVEDPEFYYGGPGGNDPRCP